jgi:glucokinase
LYVGSNDLAGEVGHVRLEVDGPIGYGKRGSFEGFCSGGGIAQIAQKMAAEQIRDTKPPVFCPTLADLPKVTAESVGLAAQEGDPLAVAVYDKVARQLGRGLALLVDILNPERIILGSIYTRQQALLEPHALEVLREEALPLSLAACEIVPSGLGEQVGDLAAISVAQAALEADFG